MRDKFATPILYGIDNFKFYDIFPTYTKLLITSFVYVFDTFSHIHFYSNCFSSILRHSSQKRYVLLKTKHIIKIGYKFLVCNRYRVYLLMKKN